MRRLRNTVLLAGLMAAAGALGYRYLLTEEARTKLKASVTSVAQTWANIVNTLGDSEEEAKKAEARVNQARTSAQWDALGY